MKRALLPAMGITMAACAPALDKPARAPDVPGQLDLPPDWLPWRAKALHRILPDDWVELTAPEEVEAARHYHVRGFLAPVAAPFHEARPVRLWAHVGDIDVLRLRYAALSFQIELVEIAAGTLAWVDPSPPPGPDREARIRETLALLLPDRRTWSFFPGGPGEALRFSTDPKGGPHDADRGEREVDGGIVAGRMYLARYDSNPMSALADSEPFPQPWLGGAVRTAWKVRRPHPPPICPDPPVPHLAGDVLTGPPGDVCARAVNEIHRISPDDYIELTTKEEKEAAKWYFTSALNSAIVRGHVFLGDEANPWNPDTRARHWAHIGGGVVPDLVCRADTWYWNHGAGPDVLRSRFAALGMELEVFETAMATLVWADGHPPPGADAASVVREVVSRVIDRRLVRRALTCSKGSPEEAVHCSSDDETGVRGAEHAEKGWTLDAGLVGHRVYLLRYKPAATGRFDHVIPDRGILAPVTDAWKARRPHPSAR